ncbi:hypothetical protein AGR3A_Lc140164 [Agrobacterium tomkonis CFBP 6623]|uniref:Uncharacterized protein n=1 Tax=Agrobacterium tomkonis CFBP 6623 TaxID=1183432 RepID=A0A1S7RP24_9HYPH|nr:hypothetical protein AGR3A_Lc140164 [Agrobacterium tomkonis CFBP 6623]
MWKRPLATQNGYAFITAASVRIFDRCVPVATTARASLIRSSSIAIEDRRKLVLVANAKDNKRGQLLRIRSHTTGINLFTDQLLTNETAHVFVTDACDDCTFIPRRAAPHAMFVGLPPMYLWKVPMSSRRPPTCAP